MRMIQVGYVEIRIGNKILVVICEGKRQLWRTRQRWEDIETDLKKRGYGMDPLGSE
jgi:hypothetical protein